MERTGWSGMERSPEERIPRHFGDPNHPVCAAAVASHLFLDGAATPPVSGGELPASHSFAASKTAPTSDSRRFATTSEKEGNGTATTLHSLQINFELRFEFIFHFDCSAAKLDGFDTENRLFKVISPLCLQRSVSHVRERQRYHDRPCIP